MSQTLTKFGQSAAQLSSEFFAGIKSVQSGSKDMDDLFSAYLDMEPQNLAIPKQGFVDAIQNVCHTQLNGFDTEFFSKKHPNVSFVLLAWICMGSSAIPDYIDTLLGIICTEFYKTHKSTERVTLAWYGEQGANGKLIDFRGLYPWMKSAKTTEGKIIFNVMSDEELYPNG